jgi:hypothetical protein
VAGRGNFRIRNEAVEVEVIFENDYIGGPMLLSLISIEDSQSFLKQARGQFLTTWAPQGVKFASSREPCLQG